jgi:hypothetical protein
MPKMSAKVDPHMEMAVSFLQRCPAVTVKEGMMVAGFSKEEIKDQAKQAWIYRCHKKRVANTIPPSESVMVPKSGEGRTVSSISLLSPNNNNITVHAPPPEKTCTQMNANQKQKQHKAALDKMHHYKYAVKHATITYTQEKGKGKDGLSAKGMYRLIKEAFKVDLCPRTIQKKVKSGDIGLSPLRSGPKGMMDELHFKNLCIAAESYVVINQNSGTCVSVHSGNCVHALRRWFVGSMLKVILT